MKTKIIIVVAFLCSLYSFGQVGTVFTAGGLKFKITGVTTVEVSANTNINGVVQVPQTTTYNGVNYEVTTIGERAFFNCVGLKSVTIPNSVNNIGLNAFYNCTGLTMVVIPNSVKTIGDSSFRFCTALTSVALPNSVTSIGKGSFSGCINLTTINIPDQLQVFSQGLFSGCSALSAITVPDSVTSIGNSVFESCSNLTSITIPNTLTSIGSNAFRACSSLTTVTIPNSIVNIGDMAFADCIGLNIVALNSINPLLINRNVFNNLNLSDLSLNVPVGTELIYKTAPVWKDFHSISELNSEPLQLGQTFVVDGINYFVRKASMPYEVGITSSTNLIGIASIPATVSSGGYSFAVTSIGNSGFKDAKGLTAIIVPETIKTIGSAAFLGCTGLTSITIPNSVTSISSNLFSDCTNLKSIILPNSIVSIGVRAFSNCKGLPSITIPSSVVSIGDFSFENCSGLTALTVNWTIPLTISANVFTNIIFDAITLNVPAGTESAYKAALIWKDFIPAIKDPPILGLSFNSNGINYYVTKATLPYEVEVGNNQYFTGSTATIPDKVLYMANSFAVTAISDNAFNSCTALTVVTLPNAIKNIGNWAFRFCSKLKSINIPNSTISIGRNAFNECTSLANITIPNSVSSIGYGTFSSCNSLKSVIIPDSVTSIGDFAFANSGLTSVKIGNSITNLSEGIFYYCGGITSVNIPSSIISIGRSAFENCTSLTTITIPDSVNSIGLRAFLFCTGLKSIVIPDTVSTIQYEAFGGCTSLASVKVAWITPLLLLENSYVFGSVNLSTVTLNVPQGTETAYKSSTVWRDFKVETTLGANSFSTNNSIPFYPNPAKYQINFTQEINTLDVFDIAGKKVKSFQNPSRSFDVSNLANGTYIIKCKTDEGKTSSQKMLKQ
jgi:BspA type Leucine rich repeat region (6 copies)/Secretion system C-terminal sorting domain